MINVDEVMENITEEGNLCIIRDALEQVNELEATSTKTEYKTIDLFKQTSVLFGKVAEIVEDLEEISTDHEKRIKKLEKRK